MNVLSLFRRRDFEASSNVVNKPATKKARVRDKVTKFTNCRVLLDGKLRDDNFWIQSGKVVDAQDRFWEARENIEFAADEVIDCKGGIIAPGFIDVQINGAVGVDFSNPNLTEEKVTAVAQHLLSYGVTGFCPTIVTSRPELYARNGPLLYRRSGGKGKGAHLLGMHLEGPFINHQQKGAHDRHCIRYPDRGMDSVHEMYGGDEMLQNVSLVTLAPEIPGALAATKGMAERGIVVSIGHTSSDISEATAALESGASMVTHLFNAMQAFHHRDPGVLGLIGMKHLPRRLHYGLIADGIHCHPSALRMAFTASPERVVLVTDAMEALGLKPGRHVIGQMQVDVVEQPTQLANVASERKEALNCTTLKARVVGSSTLAGSVVSMIECVRNFWAFVNCSLEQALESASLHPARVLGIDKCKGHLGRGADADFVILSPGKLEVLSVYVNGELEYSVP